MSTTPIPIGQFAAAIRAKHPSAYDNRSDAELVQAYVNKYPAYKDRVAGFAETNFEKDKSKSDFLGGLTESIPSIGSTLRRAAFFGLDPLSDVQAISSVGQTPENFRTGVQNAKDIGMNDAGSRVTSGVVNAFAPFVGIDPQSMRARAESGDTAGIVGQTVIPTLTAATPLLKRGANAIRSGISNAAYTDGVLNPKVAGLGDALEHPTTIPGKLIKAGASTLFPPPPVEPPAWEAPSHSDVYGSPDFPGPTSKLSSRLPTSLRGDPFAPRPTPPTWETPSHTDVLGTPDFPGRFSKIPSRIAPQFRGDPFAPPSGETVAAPTEWESNEEMLRRGAGGVNPAYKSIRRNYASDPQDLISRMRKIAVPGEEPSVEDIKRAGDFTQVSTEKLRTLAKFGDKLAQNELNRRLKQ